MDESVVQLVELLREWGLGHAAANFVNAGISISNFPTLRATDVRTVFTDINELVTFLDKLDEWRGRLPKSEVIQGNSTEGTSEYISPPSNVNIPDVKGNVQNVPYNTHFVDCDFEEDSKHYVMEEAQRMMRAPSFNYEHGHDNEIRNANNVADTTNYLPHASSSAYDNDPSLDLKLLLNEDSEGKTILSVFSRTGFLTPRLRSVLVHKIVTKFLNDAYKGLTHSGQLLEFKVSRAVFEHWAEQIHEVFPTEAVATYYNAYRKEGGHRYLASGKLWDHYNYTKKLLHENRLLSSKKFERQQTNNAFVTVYTITDEDDQRMKWLQTNTEPWQQVLDYWDKTFPIRKQQLQTESVTVDDYLKNFQCLRQEDGADLIKSDFEKLHPGKGDMLLCKWTNIRQRLLKLLQGPRKPNGIDDRLLVNRLGQLDAERQDGIILFLLSTLMKPTHIKYSHVAKKMKADVDKFIPTKASSKRPSIQEAQQAFLLHISKMEFLDAAIEMKREECRRKGESCHGQMVFVGPLEDLQACYVVNEDIRYLVANPVEALDLAFKSYYALGTHYPLSAYHIWLFVQKAAYDIVNPGDKFGTNITSLIGEVVD